MNGSLLLPSALFLFPLLLSLLLTALLVRWAPRLGLVDQPGERKVHTRPIPHGGGLAIYLSLVLTLTLLAIFNSQSPVLNLPFPTRATALFLALCTLLVLVGLLDDVRSLSWQVRLAVQGLVAAGVVLSASWEVGWPVRVLAWFWVVALTNAFNMLDNMDALAGGVAWIAAGMFALPMLLRPTGGPDWASAAPFLMLMGALAGFLWFNRPPARIFMGDAGSTFLGFFLAVRSLDGGIVDAGNWQTWLVPVAVLAVPWYDMIIVVAIRLSQGRSPFHADKQHLSHRLVDLGLSKAWAVAVIHLLALASGAAALAFYWTEGVGTALLVAGLFGGWACVAAIDYVTRRRLTTLRSPGENL